MHNLAARSFQFTRQAEARNQRWAKKGLYHSTTMPRNEYYFPRVYRFMPAVLHSPSATCRHGRRPRLSVRPTVRRDGHCAAAAQSAVCSRYVLSVLLSRAVSASACAGARCRIENGRRPQDLPGSQAILHQRCTNVPWPERDANSRLPDRKSRVGCKTLWSRVSRQSLELRGYFRRAP